MTIDLGSLAPAAFEAWTVVFEIDTSFGDDWVVVGGQMIALHAASLEIRDGVRPTDDVDVLVDVRARPAATRDLGRWLSDHDFDHAGASPEGIGHRYTRQATAGPGTVIVDVLAPEGLGIRTATGGARRPDLLGALVANAAATTIPVRENPMRDWQDTAMLLAHIPDPFSLAEQTSRNDRQRHSRLTPLHDRRHRGWDRLSDQDHRRLSRPQGRESVGVTGLEPVTSRV